MFFLSFPPTTTLNPKPCSVYRRQERRGQAAHLLLSCRWLEATLQVKDSANRRNDPFWKLELCLTYVLSSLFFVCLFCFSFAPCSASFRQLLAGRGITFLTFFACDSCEVMPTSTQSPSSSSWVNIQLERRHSFAFSW